MLLDLCSVNKIYNGKIILEDVNLTVNENDRIGLIGVNGCGKTTLIKMITGAVLPDHLVEGDSTISFSKKASIGYLAQTDGLDSESTVIEEMRLVFKDILDAGEKMARLAEEGRADSSEYAELFSWFEANDGYNVDVKIKTILNGMGFGEELFDRNIHSFSGGEKTRLAIAKLLLEEPNLLILDEPTNHLDFSTVAWLEDYLSTYNGALIVVSHDRYFLDKTATSICEIENCRLTRFRGNYSKYLILKEELKERLAREYEKQQQEIAKLEDYAARNIARASTSKSAKSRLKALDRMERLDNPFVSYKRPKLSFNNYFIEPPQEVLNVKNIDLTVGEEKKTLLDDISFTVRRGERFAIVGDNGIGKSTLLKVLQNIIHHKGIVRWSQNVKYSYFEQESESLDKSLSIIDTLKEKYPSMTDHDARSLLGALGIRGEEVFKEVGVVSGGERAKVCFALMTLDHANVLILDEPTNHLDIFTREVLEEALCSYTGTIIFVSHDRYLLNRAATQVFELTRGGCELFKGNFDAYMSVKKARAEESARAEEAVRAQREEEAAKTKKENLFRSKEQRKEAAKRRERIRELEKAIEEAQEKTDLLSARLSEPEVMQDFQLMNEICTQIDELKQQMERDFDELCEIE